MEKSQRMREVLTGSLTADYLNRRKAEGWVAVAVEWERVAEARILGRDIFREEVPFGLMISDDCLHLETNPSEAEALSVILHMVAADKKLSEVAAELNRLGFSPRHGSHWTQAMVFNLLPRMIETAPRLRYEEGLRQAN